MFKLQHLFIAMIFFGLIVVEAVPILSKMAGPAQSERKLTSAEQNLIMSIMEKPTDTAMPLFKGDFISFNSPLDPSAVAKDSLIASPIIGGATLRPVEQTPPSDTATSSSILADVLPPIGSDLYYAYQDGGKLWYEKSTNILVIMTNEAIRSFNKKTGDETVWMQDRLAYPPITDPDAYTNYQKNYRAIIVAETTQWVLMEFPSGGLVKVMKPQYTKATSGGGTIYGLPTILPNYGN